MKELIEHLTEKEIEKYILFMDNCTVHLTTELFQFYREKIKFLFNIPYRSNLIYFFKETLEVCLNFITLNFLKILK